MEKHLFLALPVYGAYHPLFVPCLARLLQQPPARLTLKTWPGDSLVCRARNALAAQFLRSDATHLLFLDTDLIFSPEHIAALCEHDVEIVGGLYPKKQPELEWVVNMLDDEVTTPDPDTGLQRVKYVGTGCMLIKREVLEWMMRKHPELAYQPDHAPEGTREHDFFSVGVWRPPGVGPRRYLSEDWYFCQRACDLGFDIYADTRVALKHCGDAVYPLQDLEATRLNDEPDPVRSIDPIESGFDCPA